MGLFQEAGAAGAAAGGPAGAAAGAAAGAPALTGRIAPTRESGGGFTDNLDFRQTCADTAPLLNLDSLKVRARWAGCRAGWRIPPPQLDSSVPTAAHQRPPIRAESHTANRR